MNGDIYSKMELKMKKNPSYFRRLTLEESARIVGI